jgi:hypothetical protein
MQKRLKLLPKYTIDIVENKDTHKWMTDKRIKSMTKAIESGFNTNRLTEKIDKKAMNEYMIEMQAVEHRLYWEKLHLRTFEDEFEAHYDKYFAEDIETLPSYLRDEYMIAVKQDNEEKATGTSLTEEVHPDNLYWEQTMRMNSEEESKLLAVQYRVRKMVESRLMEDE